MSADNRNPQRGSTDGFAQVFSHQGVIEAFKTSDQFDSWCLTHQLGDARSHPTGNPRYCCSDHVGLLLSGVSRSSSEGATS